MHNSRIIVFVSPHSHRMTYMGMVHDTCMTIDLLRMSGGCQRLHDESRFFCWRLDVSLRAEKNGIKKQLFFFLSFNPFSFFFSLSLPFLSYLFYFCPLLLFFFILVSFPFLVSLRFPALLPAHVRRAWANVGRNSSSHARGHTVSPLC